MENNKKLLMKIYQNQNAIDILNAVVGIMFKRVKEKTDCELSISDKKRLLESFERVMKCLRRIELGNKNLYEKQEDNIEILIELSETYDIEDEFERLLEEYQKYLKEIITIDIANVIFKSTDEKKKDEEKIYNLSSLKYLKNQNV